MKARAAFCLPFSFILLLSACTKTPDVPQLPKQPETRIETLLVGDKLGAREIKDIFSVLNEDGRFDGLTEIFSQPSERDLDQISELANYYLYENARDPDGLLSIVSRRSARKGFSEWQAHVRKWAEREDFASLVELALALWAHPNFNPIADRGVLLLDPQLATLVERVRQLPSPEKKGDWEKLEAPTAEALMTDLDRFFSADHLIEDGVKVAAYLDQNAFGEAVLMALHHLQKQHDSAAPFEGFAYGMRRMLQSEPDVRNPVRHNKLDLLLYFAEKANGSTEGFFATLEKEIDRDPMLMHALSEFASPIVAWSVKRAIGKKTANIEFWQKAIKSDEAAQKEIFKQVYRGIATIRGYHESFDVAVNPFFSNLATELNAYAISRWLEELIKANAVEIKKLVESGEFSEEKLWNIPVGELKFDLSFVDWKTEGENTVAVFPQHDAMLARNFFPDTLETLELNLEKRKLADYSYRFHTMPGTLGNALERAIESSNQVLAYSDPKAFLTTLAVFVARPEKGILSTFDTTNMMDSLNAFIGVQSLFFLRRAKSVIFEDLKLGKIPWEGEGGLKGFIEPFFKSEPQVLEKVRAILASLQPIYYFDSPPAAGLATPFELYHAIMHYTRGGFVGKDRAQSMTELLSFLSKARFANVIEHDGEFELQYPGLGGWILESDSMYGLLNKLSHLEAERPLPWVRSEREVLLETVERLLGVAAGESGMRLVLETARSLHSEKPSSLQAGIGRILELGAEVFPDLEDITIAERHWLIEMVQRQDHVRLKHFLSRYLDRQKALRLVESLLGLEKDGSIQQALTVLSHLDNERIQYLSRVLLEWQGSGELRIFLESLREVFLAVQKAPPQTRVPPVRRQIRLEKWNR